MTCRPLGILASSLSFGLRAQVSVRTKAQGIGIAAIRRAAVQRQLDEELAAERKAVAALLTAGER